MTRQWCYLDSGLGEPGYNMALDAALLESMPRLDRAVLRFYGWTRPAASFGYFQRYGEVEVLTSLRPLVRRPTAGGIVPHDADWTYSLAVPISDPWYKLSARESYRAIHEWLRASFASLGMETELAPKARKELPGQCFVGHEQHDLLHRGRKIAGAAQRRTGCGLLIQGSVQPPVRTIRRAEWQSGMLECGRKLYDLEWAEMEVDADLELFTGVLLDSKYSRDIYNRKR
jgi:lipoate-protein ligase A